MQYVGSKRRIKKKIIPLLLAGDNRKKPFIDMFVGGANVIDSILAPVRIGNDIHTPLICMWQELQKGWKPPKFVSEQEYRRIKYSKEEPLYLKAYVGFNSFGSKYFAGYPRSKCTTAEEYWLRHYRFIMRQVPLLKKVKFTNYSYNNFPFHKIKQKCVVYCDIPYKGTLDYGIKGISKKIKFDHTAFYDWVRVSKEKYGHTFYISEYQAPADFTCIWEKELTVTMHSEYKKATERLFKY